jgi:hypothetical protein
VRLIIIAVLGLISGTAFADPCPGRLMEGRVQTRPPDQRAWNMRATVGGKIMLIRPDSTISGHAKVTCASGHLIAAFLRCPTARSINARTVIPAPVFSPSARPTRTCGI